MRFNNLISKGELQLFVLLPAGWSVTSLDYGPRSACASECIPPISVSIGLEVPLHWQKINAILAEQGKTAWAQPDGEGRGQSDRRPPCACASLAEAEPGRGRPL